MFIMDNHSQIEVLNDLVVKNRDAQHGYKDAAENVESPHLKQMFQQYAQQRDQFGNVLKQHILSIGGEVEQGDTIASKLHRAWMDVKSALSTNDEKSILEEVKRGESNALSHYESALEEIGMNNGAYGVIANQRGEISAIVNTVDNMLAQYSDSKVMSDKYVR